MNDTEMMKALGDVRDELVRRAAAPLVVHGSRMTGQIEALVAMQEVAKQWARGAAENDAASGSNRAAKPVSEQTFVVSDILTMIEDAARDLKLPGLLVRGKP